MSVRDLAMGYVCALVITWAAAAFVWWDVMAAFSTSMARLGWLMYSLPVALIWAGVVVPSERTPGNRP